MEPLLIEYKIKYIFQGCLYRLKRKLRETLRLRDGLNKSTGI